MKTFISVPAGSSRTLYNCPFPETTAIPFSAAILHCMSLCGVVLLKVSVPEGAFVAVLSINTDRKQFYSHFGIHHAVFCFVCVCV